MNLLQIVVKTIISTVNVLLTLVAFNNAENTDSHKRVILVFTLANLIGVWI